MPDSEDERPDIPQPEDPLLFKIKQTILDLYEPVQQPMDATLRMTTAELYLAVQKLYPSAAFTEDMLANWLHEKGFTFWDAGGLRFEWLLKSNQE